MEEEKHLNVKKVIITVAIFIFAFIVILGSALLTNKLGKSRKEKNLEIKDPSEAKIAIVQNKEEHKKEKDENKNTQNNMVEENKVTSIAQGQSNGGEVTSNTRVPVANPNAISLCKQAQTSSEKNIYLTFDDGPSPHITPQILDILKQYNVPATFFVLGSRVELYPDLVKRAYNEGHYIANHGYSHKYSSIYSSVQSVIDEYNKTDIAIKNALGNPNYNTLLFRFPGGSSGGPYDSLKRQAKGTLESMGIASTNWNCLNGDAEAVGRTKEELVKRLYETASEWDSLVVLMHDADDKQTTVDALPEIIEHYLAEGYTFKNYYDIFK